MDFDTIYEGENAISDLIKNDNNCSAHFEYTRIIPDSFELTVVTYNPSHKNYFHLHTLIDKSKIDCLKKMYEHIHSLKKTLKKKDSPYLNYTIEWYNPKTSRVETSSFYGENIQKVLSKFFYGKHKKNILIRKIILNPANPEC